MYVCMCSIVSPQKMEQVLCHLSGALFHFFSYPFSAERGVTYINSNDSLITHGDGIFHAIQCYSYLIPTCLQEFRIDSKAHLLGQVGCSSGHL